MNKWQLIETAPKDGTDVLLYTKGSSDYYMVGSYNLGDAKRGGTGWSIYDHWMPLPAPPAYALG